MVTTFKIPDIKAPRYRKPWKDAFDSNFCNKFKKKYSQYKDISNLTLKTIISNHSGKIWNTVIDNTDGVSLPESLGDIFIGSCQKQKRRNIDYHTSAKLGKIVEHKNWETDGFMGKIFYTNYHNRYSLKDREIWRFRPARQFKRAVSATYPINWKQYVVVDNFDIISKLGKKTRAIDEQIMKDTFSLDLYNEFEF